MIEITKASVLEQFNKKNGYEYDSDVIYGGKYINYFYL